MAWKAKPGTSGVSFCLEEGFFLLRIASEAERAEQPPRRPPVAEALLTL